MTFFEDSLYSCSHLKDDNELAVTDLCICLTKLESNYPTVNFTNLLHVCSNVILKFNAVCQELCDLKLQFNCLENSVEDITSCLLMEKSRYRTDMDNSFKSQDHLIEENNLLNVKIQDLNKELQHIRKNNTDIHRAKGELDKLLNEYESLQFANRKLIAENGWLQKNLKRNELSREKLLTLKPTLNNDTPVNCSDSKSRWLSDDLLSSHFNILNTEMSKCRDDVLFIDPAVTHLLKLQAMDDVLLTLRDLNFDKMRHIFFCINDSMPGSTDGSVSPDNHQISGGTHWSLLVFDSNTYTAAHYDSANGLNLQHARMLLANLGLGDVQLYEGAVAQQTADHECGIHTIINARLLAGQLSGAVVIPTLHTDIDRRPRLHSFPYSDKQDSTRHPYTTPHTTSPNSKLNSTDNNPVLSENRSADTDWLTVKSKKNNKKRGNNKSYKFSFNSDTSNRTVVGSSKSHKKTKPKHDKNHSLIRPFNGNKFAVLDTLSKPVDNVICKEITTKQYESEEINEIKQLSQVSSPGKNVTLCNSIKKQVILLSDSQGRGFGKLLKESLKSVDVLSFVKPNCTMGSVIADSVSIDHLSKDDFLVLMAGTNNIPQRSNELTSTLSSFLERTSNTNVIVVGIPNRYDIPSLNSIIALCNSGVQQLVSIHPHATFVSLQAISRCSFTHHGLHLNMRGKSGVAGLIIKKMHVCVNQSEPFICCNTDRAVVSKSTVPPPQHSLQSFLSFKSGIRNISKEAESNGTKVQTSIKSRVFLNSNMHSHFLWKRRTRAPNL